MTSKLSIAVLSLFLFQVAANAKIYGPKRYDAIGLITYASADLYYTTENFDANSKVSGLLSDNNYMVLDIPFGLRYNVQPTWAIEAELKATYAKSKSSDPFNGGERTNSEIHEARFATDLLIETNAFDLIPEFELVIPFTKISSTTDSVMLGDGVQTMTGKLHVQTEFGQGDFFSYLGYQKRDQGRSDLLPWSIGMGWNSGGSLLGARLFGFQSISDDKDKNFRFSREYVNNKVNGGSLKYYSVNPSVMSVEGLWFFKLQRQLQVQLHFGLDLAGQSYSKGMFGGLNFVFDWGEKQRSLRHRPKREVQQPRGNGIAVETETIDFREDTNESTDQKYFAEPPPPRVQPVPQPRQRNRGTRPAGPSDRQLKDQMDDVEMQIELKRKKK